MIINPRLERETGRRLESLQTSTRLSAVWEGPDGTGIIRVTASGLNGRWPEIIWDGHVEWPSQGALARVWNTWAGLEFWPEPPKEEAVPVAGAVLVDLLERLIDRRLGFIPTLPGILWATIRDPDEEKPQGPVEEALEE